MEVRVHFTKLLAAIVLIGGCTSNWTGDPFDNPYESTPHWPDCDGDGLGDGLRLDNGEFRVRECVDPNGSDQPPACEGVVIPDEVTPKWVKNSRDCDDSYPLSGGGGRNGAGCPSSYVERYSEGPLTPDQYEVVKAGGRDFLIVRGIPLSAGTASLICKDWAAIASPEDNGESLIEVEPLATLNTEFEQGRVIDSIQSGFPPAAPDDPPQQWVGWVGVTTSEIDTSDWAWNVEGEGVSNQITLPFCSGAPPEPLDILRGVSWADTDGDGQPDITDLEGSQLMDSYEELRLVMVVEPDVDVPCLTWADDEEICPGQVGCMADFICERPTLEPNDVEVFLLDEANSCITGGG